eukprot:5836429-Pyramimonas_sp.AAC.1
MAGGAGLGRSGSRLFWRILRPRSGPSSGRQRLGCPCSEVQGGGLQLGGSRARHASGWPSREEATAGASAWTSCESACRAPAIAPWLRGTSGG